MPSKTFFHLPAEKRERLLLAAEEEFARVIRVWKKGKSSTKPIRTP